jgi:hypothetical protein
MSEYGQKRRKQKIQETNDNGIRHKDIFSINSRKKGSYTTTQQIDNSKSHKKEKALLIFSKAAKIYNTGKKELFSTAANVRLYDK